MEENTKANKGASVTKAGTIAGQSSSIKAKGALKDLPAELGEDTEMESDSDDRGQDLQGSKAQAAPASSAQGKPAPGKAPAGKTESGKSEGKRQDHEVIGEQIGRRLRTVYNDMLAQPVPDRFLDLLRELEKDSK